jgi:hypothetical protein
MLQFSKIVVKYPYCLFFAGFEVYTIYVRSSILGCPQRPQAVTRGEKLIFSGWMCIFRAFTGYIENQVPQVTLGRDC